MSDLFRRYEVLLPLKFNDGQPVPYELIGDALIELREQFGAVSSETQVIRGQWQHRGQVFHDNLIRVFVDVPDLPAHRVFFQEFKERLKSQFKQIDVWMTTYPVEIL